MHRRWRDVSSYALSGLNTIFGGEFLQRAAANLSSSCTTWWIRRHSSPPIGISAAALSRGPRVGPNDFSDLSAISGAMIRRDGLG
jgi:hypothetical protein